MTQRIQKAAAFRDLLERNRTVWSVLERAPAVMEGLGIAEWYIGAGCLTQSAWNALSALPPMQHIKDIDVVYYDAEDLWSRPRPGSTPPFVPLSGTFPAAST